jgi:NAD(P)-dependent dehydrogenase (short-subunit alcohol dehydrogenase family)
VLEAFSLKGKVAIVTGAAQGLGEAMARSLAQSGANVIVVDINEEKGRESAKNLRALGGQAKSFRLDVSDRDAVNHMVSEVKSDFGKINILINSAGLNRRYWMKDMTSEDYDLIMNVNLKGTFNTCQEVGRVMIEQGTGGSIINVSSMSSLIVNRRRAVGTYCASKGGVNMLTKAFAAEWAEFNIRVNAIAPGYFKTPLNEPWINTEQGPDALSQVPMGRFAEPEEIGPTAVYLASDASSYVTGHILVIDGGYTIW